MKKGSKKKIPKKPEVPAKSKVIINTLKPVTIIRDELRRSFRIENITNNTIEIAGYIFEGRKIKKLQGITIEEYKLIRTCKSLKII